MLPTAPVVPLLSMTRRHACTPAGRLTPALRIVVHVCQPPVFGICIGPVTSAPFTSRCRVPPAPAEATRKSRSYTPDVPTLTVYFSHSPADTQPRSYPPPESDADSISTAVFRY